MVGLISREINDCCLRIDEDSMPRIVMTEHYTCGEQTFRRGNKYDVTDARARMLIGRGSAVPQGARPAARSEDTPAVEEPSVKPAPPPVSSPSNEKPANTKPAPAPKPAK